MSDHERNTTPLVGGRPSAPVAWAFVGLCFLALAAYVWASWILSPAFRPAPMGSDPVPENVRIAVRATEVILTCVGMITLWRLVLRPISTSRRLTADGMLVLNFTLLVWTDPMVNYMNHTLFYNSYAFNMGSWGSFIPGWSYPNEEKLAWPLLWMTWFYVVFWILAARLGCWILREFQRYFPRKTIATGLLAVFVVMALLDTIMETTGMMGIGISTYSGVIRSLSLSAGAVNQWPIYEAFIIGFVCTGFTAFRYFKDDRGQTFVERGIETMRISESAKSLVRFLAIAGFLQPFFAIGYYLPYNLFALHVDSAPAYPSYMRTGICGTGTLYACPNANWVPIPTRTSKLVVGPDDPRLPVNIRDAQGIPAGGRDPYAR